MFLKALEIQGFKSFPDKTRLTFEKGLTTVVGPNGSGKSNIADAISWVMGEQSVKNLRGGKMEDVIFGGTQKRRPTGFSQVSITFDNTDHHFDIDEEEVTLTRRYYRSGESEYSINHHGVRLRDVHEILMDTGLGKDGYGIISQGRITEIVSSKSGERREIFEEAAGISKFRYRREQAERQLEKAADNLARLQDILSELEGRIEPLRIQSEKAEKFLALSTEKKEIEISVQVEKLAQVRVEIREHENRLSILQAEYDQIDGKLQSSEDEITFLYEQMTNCTLETEKLQQEKKEAETQVSESEKNVAVMDNNISHGLEKVRRLEEEKHLALGETESFQSTIVQQEKMLEQLFLKLENIEKELQQVEKEWADILLESDQYLRQKEMEKEYIRQLEKEISSFDVTNKTLKLTKEELISRLDELKNTDQEFGKNEQQIQNECIQLEYICADLETRISKNVQEKNGKIKNYQDKEREIHIEKQKIEEKELLLKQNVHRIEFLKDIDERMEDAPKSVKFILSKSKEGLLEGILGTVAQKIKVSPKYLVAVETVGGMSLQNIIVEREEDAKKGIFLLKQEKVGRTTFLPVKTIKSRKIDIKDYENQEGFIGVLSDCIHFEEKYQNIIESIFGRIMLCDTLENATKLAKRNRYQCRMVTLDGQVINAGGSLTGGSQIHKSGVLSRRNEIEFLQNKKAELQNEVRQLNEKAHIKIQKLKMEKEEVELFIQQSQELEQDKMRATYQLESMKKQLEDYKKQKANMCKELENIQNRLQRTEAALKNNRDLLQEKKAEYSKYEERLKEMDIESNNLQISKEALQLRKSDLKLTEITLQKDQEAMERILEENQNRINNQEFQLKEIKLNIQTEKDEIKSLRQKIQDTLYQNQERQNLIQNIQINIEEFYQKKQVLEAKANEIRKNEKSWIQDRENASRELARLGEQKRASQQGYDQVVASLWDEYELTVSEAKEIAKPVENLQKVTIQLQNLRNEIKMLGTVNVSAIEEYKEVSERYGFLKSQCEDVEHSRTEILSLIKELVQNMETQFVLTFEEINLYFGHIFQDLFGGGKASLELLDTSNLLECGIDIHVQPPGKIVKNLAALSGGEQSLVAICLYFAILKVRPAPFCLLDEIEAALDDVNVSRFAGYLRKMRNEIQFIAISHRRGTMEAADVLYGVTMQEEGVSKILRLELGEVEQELGVKVQ